MPFELQHVSPRSDFTATYWASTSSNAPDLTIRADGFFFQRDGAALMLNTLYDPHDPRPGAPDPARNAAHTDTALYFRCPDVDAVYRHLQGHGIDVQPPAVAWYGMKQLYVTDPDGFTLCFQWPTNVSDT